MGRWAFLRIISTGGNTRLRVSELAGLFKASWEGEDVEIEGVATIEEAGPAELAFVGNRKAAAAAASSLAGCLLVTPEFPSGRNLIRIAEPRTAFAFAIRLLLHPPPQSAGGIHPSAVVAPSASIGLGT